MSEVMGTTVAKSLPITYMSENQRNVTFVQNQKNLFRTSALLKIIRIKFRSRLYPWNLTLNAMRLLPGSRSIDVMEISTCWRNNGSEIQANLFCKLHYDGNDQLNRKQHTTWDFLVPIPCLLYKYVSTINHRNFAQKSAISEKCCQTPGFLPLGSPKPNPGGECFAPCLNWELSGLWFS